MMMKLPLSLVSLSIASALTSITPAYADHSGVEIIEVMGHQHQVTSSAVNSGSSAPKTDISGLLENLPGAALNSNGPVTGIAQYRGLFGDRINTQVNGVSLPGAGPNAMDTPLSYASLINSESLEVTRGIAPVSSGVDTLGGSIKVIGSQANQPAAETLRAQEAHLSE